MASPATPPLRSAQYEPMHGAKLVLATMVLSLGSFMNILDLSIANVSVPTIAGDLAVSPTQGTWVVTSYGVSEAILLPLTGWLAARIGQVRMFVFATVLFTLASFLCGTSFSFPMLLTARVMQGAVGAAMIPLAQTLLTSVYSPQRRGLALGLWSMTVVVAPIAGPLAGGWITENLSWHWIFLINLPLGAVVAAGAWSLLRERETPIRKVPVDFVGLALLIVGVGALQILLDRGNELDWFESAEIIVLACTALLSLALLVAWEIDHPHPIVDLRLFARRNFTIGVVCLFLGMIAFFGTVVVLPLWLQSYQGYTSLWAGKVVAMGGIFAMILGPIVGLMLGRVDPRAISTFGFLTFSAVAIWSAHFPPDVDYWSVALTRLLMGIAIGTFFLPLAAINLSGLAPERVAAASGLQNFMRNLGSSFGTAMLTSFWERRAAIFHADMVDNLNQFNTPFRDQLQHLTDMGLSQAQALAQMEHEISAQAYLMSTNAVLLLCGGITLSLLLLIWWAHPPFGIARPGH
ncbi:MAG: MFS transporter [Proteobacteria bacterium]|nr:MAG: MFS transporter [Pseudomonadota bacterium]